jgi:hypothetical protein
VSSADATAIIRQASADDEISAINTPGDLNGDAAADLLVGAWTAGETSTNTGALYFIPGANR